MAPYVVWDVVRRHFLSYLLQILHWIPFQCSWTAARGWMSASNYFGDVSRRPLVLGGNCTVGKTAVSRRPKVAGICRSMRSHNKHCHCRWLVFEIFLSVFPSVVLLPTVLLRYVTMYFSMLRQLYLLYLASHLGLNSGFQSLVRDLRYLHYRSLKAWAMQYSNAILHIRTQGAILP